MLQAGIQSVKEFEHLHVYDVTDAEADKLLLGTYFEEVFPVEDKPEATTDPAPSKESPKPKQVFAKQSEATEPKPNKESDEQATKEAN